MGRQTRAPDNGPRCVGSGVCPQPRKSLGSRQLPCEKHRSSLSSPMSRVRPLGVVTSPRQSGAAERAGWSLFLAFLTVIRSFSPSKLTKRPRYSLAPRRGVSGQPGGVVTEATVLVPAGAARWLAQARSGHGSARGESVTGGRARRTGMWGCGSEVGSGGGGRKGRGSESATRGNAATIQSSTHLRSPRWDPAWYLAQAPPAWSLLFTVRRPRGEGETIVRHCLGKVSLGGACPGPAGRGWHARRGGAGVGQCLCPWPLSLCD